MEAPLQPKGKPSDTNKNESIHLGQEARPDKNINDVLKERGIDAPPIDFKIAFVGHEGEKNGEFVARSIAECDVFMPELAELDDEVIDTLNRISKGEIRPDEIKNKRIKDKLARHSFLNKITQSLYGSGKNIAFIDLPKGSELLDETMKFYKGQNDRIHLFRRKKVAFDEAVEKVKSDSLHISDLQQQREEYILARIPDEFERLLRENPALLEKNKINAFAYFGSTHTAIYHRLNEAGNNTEREFPNNPYIFPFDITVQRKIQFNKEANVEDYARTLFESMIYVGRDLLDRFTPEEIAMYRRDIVGSFSLEEIKSIYNSYVTLPPSAFAELLQEHLDDKGIIPIQNRKKD